MECKNNIDKAIYSYQKMADNLVKRFCEKQGLSCVVFQDVVCFEGDLMMCFKDIFMDLKLHIEKGVAVSYMQGFDMNLDDAEIDKSLSYKEFLELKKLI